MAFVVERWIEWIVPRGCIQAIARGAHVMYLMCTGSFCAAFWVALGFGALSDDHTPSEVLRTSLHLKLDPILSWSTVLLCHAWDVLCSLYSHRL